MKFNLFGKNKMPEIKKNRPGLEVLGVHAWESMARSMLNILNNPDNILLSKGKNINEAFFPLLNDAHVSSCVQSRKAGVLSLVWELDRSEKWTAETEFINKIFSGDNAMKLTGLDIGTIINEMLDGVLFGYKPMEIYWRYIGDYLIPTAIVGKPPHWFAFDEFGMLKYLGDYSTGMAQSMLKTKFLVVQHNATSDNPYGRGVLSQCYWPVIFKKGGFQFWTQYAERYGQPFLLGIYKRDAKEEDIEELITQLNALRNGGRAAVDEDITIDTITTGNPQQADIYKNLIHFLNAEISKAILSQTLTTEQGDTGSYAMSQTHLEVRQEVVDADKRMIEHHFNQLIKYIIDYNFDNPTHYPKFELYRMDDLNTVLERDIKILATGQVKFTDQRWRKYLDEGDYVLIDPANNPPKAMFQLMSKGNDFLFSEKDIVRELAEKEFNSAAEKMLLPIIESIQSGESYEEIEKKIIEYFPKLETDKIQEIIENLNFVSAIEGYEKGK
ncbi:DUF935 family protein [Bacteroidetes/Chlorobi group bacterium ChocPot_Mid]|nr:MAG: DUF935 family protein [Bacteroidetes/Chlorobi group bacterium ChocPot_Mid]